MRPEDSCGQPDGAGVDRDLDDGVAGVVVWPAGADGEDVGQGLVPGAGGELAQPPPLAGHPGVGAQRLLDGAGGVFDSGVHVPPVVVVDQGEVAALGADDLREGADVELPVVGAGGGAGPEPVAAAEGLVRRQVAGDRPGDAQAGGAAAAGRAQAAVEAFNVAQVVAGVGPAEPGDPRQRLHRGHGQAFLLVPLPAAGAVDGDRGGVMDRTGELGEVQVVGGGEPGEVAVVVLTGDGDDGARQRPGRQRLGPVGEVGQPGRVEAGGHRVLLLDRRVADSAA